SRSRTAAPWATWRRAREARARVTSLASSGGSSMPRMYRPRSGLGGHVLRLDTGDDHPADAVPPTLRRLRLEAQAPHLHDRPGDGDRAQMLGHQPADRVDVVVLDADAEQLLEIVDVEPGADSPRPVRQGLALVGLVVVLVGDLADDLLEDVLDRDH